MIVVFGTSSHEPAQLGQLIGEKVGVRFTGRESDYRGIYLLARFGTARIEIQPNAIPGDGDTADLYADGHPGVSVLVLVDGPDQDGRLSAGIAAIDGLVLLEVWCT